MWQNDFWLLKEQLNPINDTQTYSSFKSKICNVIRHLNLTIQFQHIQLWKFQLLTQFTESFRVQTDLFGVSSSETDKIKSMLSDTNPILMVVTFLVSLLHSIFDFLAFKNGIFILIHSNVTHLPDIAFWKKKKDMEGLSLRAIVLNIVFQCIIFLYLLDNETSWVVIGSSGVGLLIEIWKVLRVIDVKVHGYLSFTLNHEYTYHHIISSP